jgi:methylated-DNA-[protein]-cysteine S-methyltransferase
VSTIDATVMTTPAGPLSLLVEPAGERLWGAGFSARPEELHARFGPRRRALGLRLLPDLGAVTKAMAAYFDGDLAAMEALVADQDGGAYEQRVWRAMAQVPAGVTASYGELARRTGVPGAARAVGAACARNLVAPVVPCHRVLRGDGGLGGYHYGLACKSWLLAHERRHAPDPATPTLAIEPGLVRS